MKKVMAVWIVLVMAVMACAVQFADQAGTPTMTASSVPTKLRIDTISLTPSIVTVIIASEGLKLRDRPDAAGPVDSVTLEVMEPGQVFIAESCKQVNGSWWAYGTYHTTKGWTDVEFLSPAPCG